MCVFFFKFLFDKYVFIDVDKAAVTILQLFQKIMTLAYFSDIKGVGTQPTFPFSAVNCLPHPIPCVAFSINSGLDRLSFDNHSS